MATTVLAVLGSLGGVVLLWRGVRSGSEHVKRIRAGRLASEKDYFLRHLDVAEVFINRSESTLHTHAELVSMTPGLKEVRTGWEPASQNEIEAKVVEGDISLREVPPQPPTGDWKDYMIEFGSPLAKGDSAVFELETSFSQLPSSPGRRRVTWISARRIDSLRLRAVFREGASGTFVASVCNNHGDKISSREIEYDRITNQVEVVFRYPKPNCVHSIEW